MLRLHRRPFYDFLLDNPWIDSIAAWREDLLLHLPNATIVSCLNRLRSLSVAFGRTAFQDLKTKVKRPPLRINVDSDTKKSVSIFAPVIRVAITGKPSGVSRVASFCSADDDRFAFAITDFCDA